MSLITISNKVEAAARMLLLSIGRLCIITTEVFEKLRGKKMLFIFVLGVVGAMVLSTDAQASNRLSDIVVAFRAQIETYSGYARTAGLTLAVSLAAIELAWTGGRIGLLQNRGPEVIGLFVIKIVVMLIIFSLVQAGLIWMGYLSGGFFTLGEGFTGLGSLEPSNTMSMGNDVAIRLLAIAPMGGYPFGISFEGIGFLIGSLIVWVAFAIVAVTQVVVLIEVWLIRELASLFLAFGLLANTAGIAEGYINYLIKVSLKVMLLFLVVHMGTGYFEDTLIPYVIVTDAGNIGIFGGIAVVSAIIFAVVATSIPNRWTEIVSNVDLGIKSLLYETRF